MNNLGLKSTLSDISIGTTACLGGAINLENLPVFHPKTGFVSVNKVNFL
jgi:hypothetical protein